MNLFFETTYQNDLIVYVGFESAVDYHNFREKIHTHSEYDTKFSNILSEWLKKGYYGHFFEEALIGHSTILYKFRFTGERASSSKEFIKDIQTYFDVYSPSTSYYKVEYKTFESLQ